MSYFLGFLYTGGWELGVGLRVAFLSNITAFPFKTKLRLLDLVSDTAAPGRSAQGTMAHPLKLGV